MRGARALQKAIVRRCCRSISVVVRLHVFDGCLTGIQSALDAARATLKSRPRRSHDAHYGHTAAGDQSKVAYVTLLSPTRFSGRVQRSVSRVRLSLYSSLSR